MDRYSCELAKHLELCGINLLVLDRGKFDHLLDWMIGELTFPLEVGQVDAELRESVKHC